MRQYKDITTFRGDRATRWRIWSHRAAGVVGLVIWLVSWIGCTAMHTEESLETRLSRELSKPVEGNAVAFIQGYTDGYEEAKRERKPMMIFFTAPRSVFCQQMLDVSFRDPRVVELSQAFTCVHVDVAEEPGVCQEFRVDGFPTIQFLSARGVPLQRIEGKCDAQRLIPYMQAAIETIASRETFAPASSIR